MVERRFFAVRSTSAGETCLDPGREIEPDAELWFSPNRPRPETSARRLTILYEDRHILIVDKAAGLLTQPTPARERDTLLERAGRYLARTRGLVKPYVGIVHRLDQATSGVILLVCSPSALRPFQALFREHAIERLYLAIVEGIIDPRGERSICPWWLTAETAVEERRRSRMKAHRQSPTTKGWDSSGPWPVRLPAGSRPAGRTRFAFIFRRKGTRSSETECIAPCHAPARVPPLIPVAISAPGRSTPRLWDSSIR